MDRVKGDFKEIGYKLMGRICILSSGKAYKFVNKHFVVPKIVDNVVLKRSVLVAAI